VTNTSGANRGPQPAGPGGLTGTSIKRKEDRRFLTGRDRYLEDIAVPGLLHLALVRSPHAHARVLGIDAEAARAAPGVVAILTAKDVRPRV
jgi:carbon-monoxide dehydrogenase large subunit